MRSIILILAAAGAALAAPAAGARTFFVDRTEDDGQPHSLRWAIEQSNAINLASPEAGGNRIVIGRKGKDPFVIKPTGTFLPPLVGPVSVEGVRSGRHGGPPTVVIDGAELVPPRTPSACPGATHTFDFATATWTVSRVSGNGPNVRGYYGGGLVVHDSGDVEISNLEIRNFCFGVGGVRSNNVNVHHMRIVDHHGAAGVIFTGDDGNAGSTDRSYNNRLADSELLDNADGFEFTRGTRDSVIEGNTIALTQPLPVDGNAIEYASSGHHNSVIGNVMTGYAITAMTVGSGNNHVIRENDISGNGSTGVSFGGSGHQIEDNNISDNGGVGVALGGSLHHFEKNTVARNGLAGVNVTSANSQQLTLSRNRIFGNGGLGIDLAPGGPNANDPLDADAGANGGLNHPMLGAESEWTRDEITLAGTLDGAPNLTHRIEFFASREPGASGTGAGEVYLGSASVTTNASGQAEFAFTYDGRRARGWHGWHHNRHGDRGKRHGGDPFGDGTSRAFFSATATDPAGATSEFGPALELTRSRR
jgi:3-dehydroshikimate dehydratase